MTILKASRFSFQKFIIFIGIFVSVSAYADDIDIGEHFACDPFWRNNNCIDRGGTLNAAETLRANTGIILSEERKPLDRSFKPLVIGTDPEHEPRESSVRGPRMAPRDIHSSPEIQSSTDAQNLSESQPTNEDLANSNGFQFPQNNNMQGSSVTPNYGGTNVGEGITKAGGMIYAEDPETAPIEAGQATPGPASYQPSPQQAIAANKASDTGSSSTDGSSPSSPSSAIAGGKPNFGEEEGASPTKVSSGGGSGITGRLQALASSMGEKFSSIMGGSSGGSGAGYTGGRRAKSNNAKARKPASTKVAGVNLNVIRDRFGNIIRRGTASSLQFGRANEHMFKGMCAHYASYAAQNRIPYDRTSCENF